MAQENHEGSVLVVEDNPDIRNLLAIHLKAEKLEVYEAYDGPSAIELAVEKDPCVILLDIMMEGLDGYDTCKILKQDPKTRDIPVIFITARIDENDMVRGLTLGAVDYIIKPFNVGIFIPKVKTFIRMRQAQIALLANEEKYRTLVENAPETIARINTNGCFIFVNREFIRRMGLPLEKILDHGPEILVPFMNPENFKKMADAVTQTLEKLENVQVELCFKNPGTGDPLWLFQLSYPWFNADGTLGGVEILTQDITKHKKSEEALLESKNRYRDLANTLPLGIFEADVTGRITYANATAFELFGYDESDIEKGFSIRQMVCPENEHLADKNLRTALTVGKTEPFEYLAQRKDGSTFPVLINSRLVLDNGRPAGIRGYIVDITERKKTEEDFQFSAALLDNTADPLHALDLEGKIIYANETMARQTGYSREELIGRNIGMLNPPEDAALVQSRISAIFKERSARFTVTHIRKNGTTYPVEVFARAMEIGRKKFIIAIDKDITGRKTA